MTKNLSGSSNMMKPSKLTRDGETDLIDGFIADKWMPPENRMEELACMYRAQRNALRRDIRQRTEEARQASYARNWHLRLLEHMEDRPCPICKGQVISCRCSAPAGNEDL